MSIFFYHLFAIIFNYGFCGSLPDPSMGPLLRRTIDPPIQFLDAAFQPCGPENAAYITQPPEYPQRPGTAFLGYFHYVPIDQELFIPNDEMPAPVDTEKTGCDIVISPAAYDVSQGALFHGSGEFYPLSDSIQANPALTTTAPPPLPPFEAAPTEITVPEKAPDKSDKSKQMCSETDVVTPTLKVVIETPAASAQNDKSASDKKVSTSDNDSDDIADENEDAKLTSYEIIRKEDGYYVQQPKVNHLVRATNFLINPKEIKHIMLGNGTERKTFVFQLVLFLRSSQMTQMMEIGSDKVKDILTTIVKDCHEAIIYHNKRIGDFDAEFQIKLREVIAECLHIYEIRFSGWFLAPSGAYIYADDGSKSSDEHITFKIGFAFGRSKGERTEKEIAEGGWRILQLANRETIGIPFLFAHLGLLYHLFEQAGYPPRTLLFIEGPTGSLKTAVSALLFNFSGIPENTIPATFRDTAASMEIKFARYRDRVLLVDDFCPAADTASRRVMEACLEQLVRFFGDGIAKGRATPSMNEVKELKPCGLVAMTGEDSAGSQSSLLRCLFLPIKKDSFDKELLHLYQTNPNLWTEYLAQFVSQIAQDAPRVIQYIKDRFPAYRNIAEGYLSEKRLVDTYASLSIAADLVVTTAQKYLPIDDAFRADLHAAVLTVCQNSELKAKTVSPVRIFCLKLIELLQQNKIYLATVSQFKENPEQYLGFEKGGFWWLWPDDSYSVIVKAYQSSGKVFPKSQTALWGDLVSSGVLIPTRSKLKNGTERLEYSTKISFGDRPRMLKIDPDRLRAIAEDKND